MVTKSRAFLLVLFVSLCGTIALLNSNFLRFTQVAVDSDITDGDTPHLSGKRRHRKTNIRDLKLKELFEAGENAKQVNQKKKKVNYTYSQNSKQNPKSQVELIFNKNLNRNLAKSHNTTVGNIQDIITHSKTGSIRSGKKQSINDRPSKDRKHASRDHYGVGGKCPDVLDLMLKGKWKQRRMTEEEQAEMREYFLKTRKQRGLPLNLEREDGLCGNITFPHPNEKWRAICDPDGPTPCCYKTACVSKPVKDCACDGCYDMRAHIHAEFSAWRTEDARCQPKKMSVEEACKVLKGSTVYFMGDSLVCHFYAAFLIAARGDDQDGAFRPAVSEGTREECRGKYMFPYGTRCTHFIDFRASLCNSTASAAFFHHFGHTKNSTAKILKEVSYLRNRPRTLLVLGMGLWYSLDSRKVKERILLPLLQYLSSPGGSQGQGHHQNISGSSDLTLPDNSNNGKVESPDSPNNWNFISGDGTGPRKPRVLWASIHAPGILKSPLYQSQMYPYVVKYNEDIRELLQAWKVPVFDTVNMTSQGLMSHDGTHYGLGVNMMKATVLLHYLSELGDRDEW
ncbi:uncharacterized protein [Littorina saxatilis]|uniref:uncharacterized protein n=1 Tax=Littorina saxatilis TaxID=31220 RepID=UPI0038B61941